MKKGKLKVLSDGSLAFYCPGCKEYHAIHIDGTERPVWGFNGNYEKPTFAPSILVKSGHYCDHAKPGGCWCNFKERFPNEGEPPFKCGICHAYITDGKIHYLYDCTHELAGQTIELPEPPSPSRSLCLTRFANRANIELPEPPEEQEKE